MMMVVWCVMILKYTSNSTGVFDAVSDLSHSFIIYHPTTTHKDIYLYYLVFSILLKIILNKTGALMLVLVFYDDYDSSTLNCCLLLVRIKDDVLTLSFHPL